MSANKSARTDVPHDQTPSLILRVSAIIVGLIGVGTLIAGCWLIALGGSWYYLIAGLAMVGTGVLLFRARAAALLLYAAVVIGTVAWAVWEIGFDWWQLVPRGDIIFLIGIYLLMPWITRRLRGSSDTRSPTAWRGAGLPLMAAMVVAAVVGLVSIFSNPHDQDGRLPGPRGEIATNYGGVPDGDWHGYGRSNSGNRWSPLAQITPHNIDQLELAWTFRTGDIAGPDDPKETTYEVTPIKVDDTVYLCTPHDWVIALDAETGREKWRYDPHIKQSDGLQHLTCRGVSYHDGRAPGATRAANGECPQRILLPTADARLIALDAKTGRPCRSFGKGGAVDLWAGMPTFQSGWYYSTSAPLVTRGLVVVAGNVSDNVSTHVPSGVIRAFDVATGELVWNFDPGNPDSTTPLAPEQHYSWSSPNSWGTSSADEELGMIYVPMGMGAVDQWGGKRPETTERFATSILALDIATGHPRWVYQTVHHDVWDMDLGGQPNLIDLTIGGRRVPAIVQPAKTGDIFILDRRTGRPIFPTPERPVPQGAAPGDELSPTQPFSSVTLMPKERVREADMWGSTMFDQLACRIHFRKLRYEGPFTPPSLQGTLVYPGNFGVFDWGGIAVDPVRQIAFANPDYMAFVDKLIPQKESRAGDRKPSAQEPASGSDIEGSQDEHGLNPNKGAPFAVTLNAFLSPLGLPCQAPPWGYVAGIDLTTGKVMWKRKNGTIRDESPIPIPFKMGVPSLGGPIMTAGGVAFLTSTLDYYIRGYDVTTGKVLWKARLPAGGQTVPMTYRSPASGRQFVLTAAGGHGSLGTKQGDYIVAYALPRNRDQ